MVFCAIARPSPTEDRLGPCIVEAVYSCKTEVFRAPGARGRGAEWYVGEAQVDGTRMTVWVKKSDKPSSELVEMFESASMDHVAKQVGVALDRCAAAGAAGSALLTRPAQRGEGVRERDGRANQHSVCALQDV